MIRDTLISLHVLGFIIIVNVVSQYLVDLAGYANGGGETQARICLISLVIACMSNW